MVCQEVGGRPKVKQGLSLNPMLVRMLEVGAGGGGVQWYSASLEGTLWGRVKTPLGSTAL